MGVRWTSPKHHISRPRLRSFRLHPPLSFDDLWQRFEPPSAGNRWDRPLIRHDSAGAAGSEGEGPGEGEGVERVYRQVLTALVEGRAPAAGFSTAVVRSSSYH